MIEALQHVIAHVLRYEVFRIGPVVITSTVVTTWVAMALLLGLVYLLTRRGFEERPRGAQAFLEIVVEFFYGMAEQFMGREGRKYAWLYVGLFIAILFLIYAWTIRGAIPLTIYLMTPVVLAVVAVPMTWVCAVRMKGVKEWIQHFILTTVDQL